MELIRKLQPFLLMGLLVRSLLRKMLPQNRSSLSISHLTLLPNKMATITMLCYPPFAEVLSTDELITVAILFPMHKKKHRTQYGTMMAGEKKD